MFTENYYYVISPSVSAFVIIRQAEEIYPHELTARVTIVERASFHNSTGYNCSNVHAYVWAVLFFIHIVHLMQATHDY